MDVYKIPDDFIKTKYLFVSKIKRQERNVSLLFCFHFKIDQIL